MKFILFIFCFSLLQSCQDSSSKQQIVNKIGEANGMDHFKNVKMLEFTFNAQHDTTPASSRHWQWYPKTNEVVFITDSMNTKFVRNDTSTQELKKLNARFTNDEYWLLYPYHLAWDKGMEVVDSNQIKAPICGKIMHKITTRYNATDGYTPGDMYDVYVDDNNKIAEWAYHKSGSAAPSLLTTWEDYKDFNGLQLAQEHKSADGKFHLWFSGIKVSSL